MTENGMLDLEQGQRAKRAVVFEHDNSMDGVTVNFVNEVHPGVETDVAEFRFESWIIKRVDSLGFHNSLT